MAETRTTRDVLAERQEIDRAVEGETVCTFFERRVSQEPDAVALRWKRDGAWQELTWRQYRDRVREATLGLHAFGFKKGEMGLIMARNRPEHLVADLAVVHAGGTGITVYNTLAPEQVEYLANHSEATVAILEDAGFLGKFLAIRDRLPHLRKVVVMEPVADAPEDWALTWDDLVAMGRSEQAAQPDLFERLWRAVQPEDLVALIYTSGTTGPPKGVTYSHRNVVWTLESARRTSEYRSGERWISYLPLAHVAERFATHWGGIAYGSEVTLCPDATQLVEYLLAVRPDVFVGVPRVWEKFATAIRAGVAAEPDEQKRGLVQQAMATELELVRHRERGEEPPAELAARGEAMKPVLAAVRGKLGLDRCRYAITSTAPLPVNIEEFFASLGMPLYQVWGQSEVTGPATAIRPGQLRLGTVGEVLDGVEMKLDEDGEILLRAPSVMVGYYKEPEKTTETVDAEGWIHTGDVGTIDEDGFLRIVDRKKELIITSSGKNISPANIEALLKHHPLIGQACVVGERRNYLTALLVLDHEVAPAWARGRGVDAGSTAELATNSIVLEEAQKAVDAANAHLSRIEQVKKFRVLPVEWTVESEELTPTLKMKRRVVNEKYAPVVEEMYTEPDAETTPASQG
jgi:long-chain acyl-CoA synthetase